MVGLQGGMVLQLGHAGLWGDSRWDLDQVLIVKAFNALPPNLTVVRLDLP